MFLFNLFSIKDNTEYCIFESINGKYLDHIPMEEVQSAIKASTLINCIRNKLGESVTKVIKMHESKYMVVTHPKREELIRGATMWEWDMQDIPDELKEDIDIVIGCMKNDGDNLRYVSDELKNNKKVVLVAVAELGYALEYAPEWLKDNEEIVLCAVGEAGEALRYASNRLRDNKKIAIAAITQNVHAKRFISKRLKKDPEIIAHIEVILKKLRKLVGN